MYAGKAEMSAFFVEIVCVKIRKELAALFGSHADSIVTNPEHQIFIFHVSGNKHTTFFASIESVLETIFHKRLY